MNYLKDILSFISENPVLTVFCTLTFVQVVPIQINPWNIILVWIRHLILGDLCDQVTRLSKQVANLEDRIDEDTALECRSRILNFANEVYHGLNHTKEHFESILHDIDLYEDYCKRHPDFKNRKTVSATTRIIEVYNNCCEEHKFLN